MKLIRDFLESFVIVVLVIAGIGGILYHLFRQAGWGTLALVNAGLAQGKNRSGLAWFLVSLLLGPLATFFIVLLDRAPPESAR